MKLQNIIVLVAWLLFMPLVIAMHKKDKVTIIHQNSGDLRETDKQCTRISVPDADQQQAIVKRWNGKEQFACKCIVSSLLDRTLKHCFSEQEKLGTFNGGDKSVITYFSDHSVKASYKDFIQLMLPEDHHSILFIINENLYDIEGNAMEVGYEKRYDDKKKSLKSMQSSKRGSLNLGFSVIQQYTNALLFRNNKVN